MSEASDRAFEPYRALYLHIPFCAARCSYCDFTTQAVAANHPSMRHYVDDLILALRHASRSGELSQIETVYIGGGTPTHLGNAELTRLVYALSLSMHLSPDVECTLEANPESLTRAMVKDLFALGVTSISLGVQTFDDALLASIGRIHSADTARSAIHLAKERFSNVSIDLICGLPGQTQDMFARDVHEALSLGVQHVSIYPLIVEEHTLLARQVACGSVSVDEDASAAYMQVASELLTQAGMQRYEVASYAYPGYESQHNQAYWTSRPYLGLGRGAVSMKQNSHGRIRFDQEGEIERLSFEQRVIEDVMLGMRMSKGVSQAFVQKVDHLVPNTLATLEDLCQEGYVQLCEKRYRPTEKGWLFGNVLYGRILDLAP